MPGDAVDLASDVTRLEVVLKLLSQIDPLHTGHTMTQKQRDACDLRVRTTMAVIRGWQRHASHTLASEYLAP